MDAQIDRALALHAQTPVIDTHSHFLLNGHYLHKRFADRHDAPWLWNPLRNVLDLPRLRAGRMASSVFTIYVPPPPLRLWAWDSCCHNLDTLAALVRDNADQVQRVETAAEIEAAFAAGKLGALAAVEGGHVIGKHIDRIGQLRRRGVRLLTLTHFVANRISDAHFGPAVHQGLSPFGREVLAACRQEGVVVDLAHCSRPAFAQALAQLDRPPLVTHTGLQMGRRSHRHLTDDQIRALAEAGGAIGVLMCPFFIKPWSLLGNLDLAADVYCHIADLVGPEHLMLGTDMDGWVYLPRGMKDVSQLPRLTAKLMERGFSEPELRGILGANFLRVLAAWE